MSVTYDLGSRATMTVTASSRSALPNVNVSINTGLKWGDPMPNRDEAYAEWDMYLERRSNVGGVGSVVYTPIGHRSGYVSLDSPSHRTFTNVGSQGNLRVRIVFHPSAYHNGLTAIRVIS